MLLQSAFAMLRFTPLFLVFALLSGMALAASTAPLPTASAASKAAAVNPPAPTGPIINSENPYTVKGVKVDVQADSSIKARDKAFIQGGRDAFIALGKRLTSDDSYKAEGVSDGALTKMIRSFEVETERASGTRYVATLTFHFKPQEVAGILASSGKEISEDPYAKPQNPQQVDAPVAGIAAPVARTVILPILRLPTRSILWEEKTPWHKAWENVLSDHPRGDVILPEGGMEDIGAISATEALAGQRAAISRMMNRAGAQGAVVVALMASDMEMSPSLGTNIQIARFDGQGQLQGTATVTLAGNPQKRLMEWLQGGAGAALGAMEEISNKYAAQGAPPQPSNNIPASYAGVVTRVLVNVPFTNMDEWAARRSVIETIPNVTNLEVLRMNRNRAMVQFDYMGEQPALDASMAQRGMKVVPAPENDGSYLLLMNAPQMMRAVQPSPMPITAPQGEGEGMNDSNEEEP